MIHWMLCAGCGTDSLFVHWASGGAVGGLGGAGARAGVFCAATARNKRLAARMRPFADYVKRTRWLWSGDLLTMYPFVAFKVRLPEFEQPIRTSVSRTAIRQHTDERTARGDPKSV